MKPSADPGRRPLHPGEVLRSEVLPTLRLTVAGAARALGVNRQKLHALLAGKTPVTPAMALRLGKLCGDGPDLWLNLQKAHDLWHAERALAEEIARIPTHSAV